jgi:hypothetical protein
MPHGLQRVGTVDGGRDLVAFGGEDLSKQGANAVGVVDNQHAAGSRHLKVGGAHRRSWPGVWTSRV